MNHWLAKNVRRLRDERHWTQAHLAETAGILLRTIQRVEKGEGASADTLQALAAAFNTDIDELQMDWDAVAAIHAAMVEESRKQEEELRKTHHVIKVTPVATSADLTGFGAVTGGVYHCTAEDDRVQDAFAALQSEMHDCIDIWDDVEPLSHREWVRSVFESVRALNELGFVVAMGKNQERWHGMDVTVLYVVAWPRDAVREWIAIEKAPIRVA